AAALGAQFVCAWIDVGKTVAALAVGGGCPQCTPGGVPERNLDLRHYGAGGIMHDTGKRRRRRLALHSNPRHPQNRQDGKKAEQPKNPQLSDARHSVSSSCRTCYQSQALERTFDCLTRWEPSGREPFSSAHTNCQDKTRRA